MKGFHVYCVRSRIADAKKNSAKGGSPSSVAEPLRRTGASGGKIRGAELGNPTQPVFFKDIEAVVSEVDLSKFNAKTIKKRLEEDAKWMEKNIRRHHEAVVEAGKIKAVIPMKFGTLFKTKRSLEAMLKKYYGKFKKLLVQLADKQEWGVKGYLEHKKFAEILKNKNKEIQELEKKRSSISEGMKWYVDRKSDELIAGQIERGVEEELQRIIKKLEKHAEEIRLNDLLPKEVGEPAKDMILNAACLVRNDALDNFKTLFQELAVECGAIGIVLIMTGPWPPYNFVQTKFQGSA